MADEHHAKVMRKLRAAKLLIWVWMAVVICTGIAQVIWYVILPHPTATNQNKE